ncbi:formate dehydrogenase gamma subunit [Hoeflea halophila]|uniref:Formate dehydrogenase gamma subunit n=1 Tax=Hoeflea halophila TaxID=714899 RepID=A0A286IF64_9HYPH|nr:formate dehydrogenase subunit gamma [Hoeflea halophila]SOE18768.1 formate dehydrogenase gamma subunit [Hoeflea halophila]
MESRSMDAEIALKTEAIVGRLKPLEGPLLPILHDVQKEFGYVPKAALPVIANGLNLSRAEVHGVVSFYHDYREEPAGRHVIKMCRAEACQSMGGDELGERLLDLLGLDWHGTSDDGAVTIEPVYCLGLCACAPAAMVDGQVIGRLDDRMVTELARAVKA